ncbi:hypothetical protein AVEN_259177-1 [Araneus ventricosus]|uniref:Uncharacterized protein n=1 Tax=Araneus ventricosus TaxID=182803 RepID=A0A4Y2KV77_ARAVE|nr:hypothetical protein AVEN_259177-1 [Araneus ventricosus]
MLFRLGNRSWQTKSCQVFSKPPSNRQGQICKYKVYSKVLPQTHPLYWFSLGVSMSCFEETQGLFWNESHNSEPLSDDEDDTCAGSPLQTSVPHQWEDV